MQIVEYQCWASIRNEPRIALVLFGGFVELPIYGKLLGDWSLMRTPPLILPIAEKRIQLKNPFLWIRGENDEEPK